MTGWLTKAKQVFKPPEQRPPETFQLSCVCGEELGGERTDREQRAICPTCNSEMFVLPVSVYPLPRIPPARPPVRKPQPTESSEEDAVEIDEDQEVAVATEAPPRDSQQDKRADGSQPKVGAEKIRGIRHPRTQGGRLFTPLRITALGIVAVLALTAFFEFRSRNIAKARSTLAEAAKAGTQALEDQDIFEAVRQFTEVARALDTLGRDDEEARRLRQLSREVFAIDQLITEPIEEMIERAVAAGGETRWAEQFESQYQGKWVVLETSLTNVGSGESFRIGFPTSIVGEEVAVLIDRGTLPLKLNEEPTAVILAGQLDSVQPSGKDPRIWEIKLGAEATLLWANRNTYELMGFQPDEKVTATLAQQKELVEVGP